MAAIKLLVLLCLTTSSFGYNAKRSSDGEVNIDKEPGTGEIQPPKDELQPGPAPPQATGQKVDQGNPTAINRGDLSEYKQWPTPQFEVKEKSAKSEPQPKTVSKKPPAKSPTAAKGSPKTATRTTTTSRTGSKPGARPAAKQTPAGPGAKKTAAGTAGTKPAPKRTVTKKGKAPQPTSQNVETKDKGLF